MRKIVAILIALAIGVCLGGCEVTDSKWANTDIGDKENVVTDGYWVLSKQINYANGRESGSTSYLYSSNGQLTSVVVEDRSSCNEYVYKYNEDGYLSEKIVYSDNGYSWSECVYLYSENSDGGHIVELVYPSEYNRRVIYQFDDSDLLIKESEYYSGRLDRVKTWKYSNGILLEMNVKAQSYQYTSYYTYENEKYTVYVDYEKGGVDSQQTYFLNEDGTLFRVIDETNNYNLNQEIRSYRYDENKLLIEEVVQKSSKEIYSNSTTRYIYTYDEHQNLIKKESFEGLYGSVPYATVVYEYQQIPMTDAEIDKYEQNEKIRQGQFAPSVLP